ncbi:alpha/beta hydrolase [Paenibacillus sp. HJGM_3]|uniref:alpha/beta hydrolase n=1 Tax=Paenibacillus sp. HJGM_3 TaxID=3379816 RepID=UPI00385CFAC7
MNTYFNIPYTGTDDGMRYIDLFVPERNPSKMCILFIHGGGWSAGSKEQFHSLASHFCGLGYTCASLSYRLSGPYKFPAQIEDARLGMSFLKWNADRYLFEPERIAAFGSSAGGHLALLLALIQPGDSMGSVPGLTEKNTLPCAVIAYCPVTDLKREKQSYAQLIGSSFADARELYRSASPVDWPQPANIPMLVINGDEDTTTPLAASEAYCQKVREAGGRAKLVVLPGVKHGFGYGVTTEAQLVSVRHAERFLDGLHF